MEECVDSVVRRNALVCIEKRCVCDERATQKGKTPDRCPYKLLHLVETKTVGLQERPRQSGKTTELVVLANELAWETGLPVYFISPTLDMAHHASRMFVTDKKVVFVSLGQVRNGWMRGQPAGLVVMDEVLPVEQKEIARELVWYEVVAAFWTAR